MKLYFDRQWWDQYAELSRDGWQHFLHDSHAVIWLIPLLILMAMWCTIVPLILAVFSLRVRIK